MSKDRIELEINRLKFEMDVLKELYRIDEIEDKKYYVNRIMDLRDQVRRLVDNYEDRA